MTNLRLVLSIALPSFTALLGFLYFFGKKRAKGKGKKDEGETESSDRTSSDETILKQNSHYGQGDTANTGLRSRTVQYQNSLEQVSQTLESQSITRELDLIEEESESQCVQPDGVEREGDLPINSQTSEDGKDTDLVRESPALDKALSKESVVVCDDVSLLQSSHVKDVSNSPQEHFISQKSVTLSRSDLDNSVTSDQTPIVSLKIQSQESDGATGRDSSVLSCSSDDPKSHQGPLESVPQVDPVQISDIESSPSISSSSLNSSSLKPNESVISTVVSDFAEATRSSSKLRKHEDVDEQTSLTMEQACCNDNEVSSSSASQEKSATLHTLNVDPDLGNTVASVSGAAEAARVVHKVCDDNGGAAAVAVTSESPGCDSNSEASNDSGRGGSVTEPLPLPVIPPDTVRYEFNFPSDLCGRLIGKNGRNINLVKEKSGANIALKNNPCTPNYQICVIEGTQAEVDKALVQIRRKFPRGQFPQVDFTPLTQLVQEAPVLMPDIMQLNLPEGVSIDIVVSNIVDAGHIFIQQPTHPTFPSLERLNHFMMACYTQDHMVPPLPRPIEVGVICAAYNVDGWFRTQVVNVCESSEEVDVKYVDYGGYARVQASMLKQIRSDFMTLPFQAVECYMGNITPLQEEEYFSEQASTVLEELTQGKLLQAQVVNRAEDGIPYIHIYQISGNRVLFINREMVNRKVVRWIEILQ